MSRMKLIFAMLVLVATVSIAPMAQAQTLKVVIAGSSAMWQATALGAYNNSTSIANAAYKTCHYTSTSNFNLVDSRSTVPTVDNGGAWIVWDYDPTGGVTCATSTAINVWAYEKVDSVVGNRCYFAAPKCTVVTNGAFPGTGGKITVWPDGSADVLPPAAVQTLFTNGQFVTVAATDIRPEDAAFATCRVNSDGPVAGNSGTGSAGGVHSDGLDGLGYNASNAPGVCPVYAAGTAQAKGVGSPIVSGYPGHSATDFANVLAFNLTGHDPISNTALPPAYTVTAVGAAPIVFVNSRSGVLANLHNVTEQQLQQAFSGARCNADVFGLGVGAINVFLREPLSGTYNTTEATVMRYPTSYPNNVVGLSMETGVTSASLADPCVAGGGKRFRAIGTGEEVKSVQTSNSAFGASGDNRDGIGFTFFSYGNVSSIANSASYGYVTLDGIDPIFASYGAGQTIDPGQPTGQGILPAQANLPAGPCPTGFPCPEGAIWGNGFSFPNLRNGTYRSWSTLRLVATGTPSTNAVALAKASNKYVVINTPDYVPAAAVTGTTDLGLKLVRSHYQQKDGAGTNVGAGPAGNVPEKGGDMGGMIIPTFIGVTTEKQTQIVQGSLVDGALSPSKRP